MADAQTAIGTRVRGWLKDRWWQLAVHGGLVTAAASMRLWDLGSRAMHHDESLHAFYAWEIYAGNGYSHTPMMHGPLQMEATAGVFYLFGDSDVTARLLYALAGIALVGVPYLFRRRLGSLGAIFVSGLLAFSPAMLYFSRFARNDILMALFTLGLVISMWRYIDEGKNRYLYVASGLLALAFSTKETSYLMTATLGLYLAMVVAARNWPAVRQGVTVGEVSPPVALYRVATGIWSTASQRLALSGTSREMGFLVLLITLTLPQWAGLASVLQDTPLLSWSNLVLANAQSESGPIGAPLRGGLVIAALVVISLVWVSAAVGLRWSRGVWWRCAVIFYAIWVLLYTTFFSHWGGIGSGMWQALSYWLVQQGEGRGGQPWYYYLMITPMYEFLPLVFAVIGGIYYTRRRDLFGRFLVYWAAATFLFYTAASEKMPWLLVNITLPLIVLAGRFFGDMVKRIAWRPLVSGGGLLLLPGLPVVVVLLWSVAFFTPDRPGRSDAIVLITELAALAALAGLGYYVARRVGYRNFAIFATVPLAAILLALSVRAAWYASYRNGDIPVEMLVYTQTSPDISRLMRYVEKAGKASGNPTAVPITVDQTSGFTWPWAWYLRNYTRISYGAYDKDPLRKPPDSSVLLIHSKNRSGADPVLSEKYGKGIRIKHRWWFPETYRGMTVSKFLASLADRSAWRNAMDYFLYRKLSTPLGSEDAYVYYSDDYLSGYSPASSSSGPG